MCGGSEMWQGGYHKCVVAVRCSREGTTSNTYPHQSQDFAFTCIIFEWHVDKFSLPHQQASISDGR
jgi:hypothetical protein